MTAGICPILQKKLDLISEYLIQGKDDGILFTSYMTKKQKKQLSKLSSYNTRFKGESNGG